MPRQVIINWEASSYYGWGVYGLNLALQWAHDPDLAAVCSMPIRPQLLALDAPMMRALGPYFDGSARLRELIERMEPGEVTADAPLLHGLDQRFEPQMAKPGLTLFGTPTIGVTFFQDTVLDPAAVVRAKGYPVMVTGSTWNARILEAYGLKNVRVVLQGVDPTLFHPGPRRGALGDRFLVFSGGKLERRKGQEIVMAAFARFAERRRDAVLVTAWHSPWPALARELNASGLAAPVVLDEKNRIDAAAWAAANGIAPDRILDLRFTPNAAMGARLREMDLAVFPNRGEGGTNLVAMECMACGVPTVLSRNTGHLNLIEDDNCYVLEQQGALKGTEGPYGGVEGWGESDVAELVAIMERAYSHREEARARGERGAATLSRLTWAETAQALKALILEHA